MIKKVNSEKATVCVEEVCVTVHGKTAQVIQVLALTAAVIGLMTLISKSIK